MNNRIAFLDGLRGVAILLVVLFHAYSRYPDIVPYKDNYKYFPLFEYGFLGVQLFFILSGFVILMTLERSKNFFSFMYKRWIRLFPAMLIATILIFSSAFLFYERPAGMPNLYSVLPGLLFIEPSLLDKIMGGGKILPLEGAFWCLYIEMKFYIVFGISYFILGKKKAVIFLILLFLYSMIGVFYPIKLKDIGLHFGRFASGCLAYFYYTNNNIKNLMSSIILATLNVYVMFKVFNYDKVYLLMAFIILSLFYIPIYFKNSHAFFANRFFLFLGFISYPLYLIHENMMIASIIKLNKFFPSFPYFALPFIPIFVLCFISYILAKKMEPLTRDFIKNLLDNTYKKIKKI